MKVNVWYLEAIINFDVPTYRQVYLTKKALDKAVKELKQDLPCIHIITFRVDSLKRLEEFYKNGKTNKWEKIKDGEL